MEATITPNPPRAALRRRLLDGIDELPSLPTVLTEVAKLDPNSLSFFDDLLALAEHDPLFAARIIHLANSAIFRGSRGPVLSVRVAITRVGSRVVRELIMTMSIMRVMVPKSDAERDLWCHALQVAIASECLARGLNATIDPGTMYLGALLHDVGRFVMLDVALEQLGGVDEASFRCPDDLTVFERNVCGIDHARLGAKAVEQWGLPKWIERFVHVHHRPVDQVPQDLCEAVGILRVADHLSMMLEELPSEIDSLDEGTIESILDRLDHRAEIQLPLQRAACVVRTVWTRSREIVASLKL